MPNIRRFVDKGLGHSSYVIDLGDGTAVVIDPTRFSFEHLAAMRSDGAVVRWTIDTHSADYVTDSPSLAADHDATSVAPDSSPLATACQAVGDDHLLPLAAGTSLQAMATPGHTPDHHVHVLEVPR